MIVHRKRERLENDHVRIAIRDNTGQSIGLAPNKAAQPGSQPVRALQVSAWFIRREKKSTSRPCLRRENRRATICDFEL